MKKVQILVCAALMLLAGVSNAQTKKTKGAKAAASTLKVDVAKSSFAWLGKKATGEHNGTIGIKSGSLTTAAGKLTGGEFVIDMNSIVCLDVKDATWNEKFVGHMKADDFFGVEKFPTSTLKISKVVAKGGSNYDVTGNLTIKGITESITFPATFDGTNATAKFDVDRTKFGIKYGSGLIGTAADKIINDTFNVDVKLVATK